MIELYHFWDSFCSFKVRLCLEEKGLDWSGHNIHLMRFENLTTDYLAINPKGLVPTLIHDGATITESSIINEYLEDSFPDIPLRPADQVERARMRLWVRHEEDQLFRAVRPASLNLMMKQLFQRYSDDDLDALLANHPKQHAIPFLKKTFKEPVDLKAIEKSRAMLSAAFKEMEDGLSNGPWLAGSSYSLADIAAAPVIDRVQRLGMTEVWKDLPAVNDWIDRLVARPAYDRARPKADNRMPAPQSSATA